LLLLPLPPLPPLAIHALVKRMMVVVVAPLRKQSRPHGRQLSPPPHGTGIALLLFFLLRCCCRCGARASSVGCKFCAASFFPFSFFPFFSLSLLGGFAFIVFLFPSQRVCDSKIGLGLFSFKPRSDFFE
jgi:hypothetical protein